MTGLDLADIRFSVADAAGASVEHALAPPTPRIAFQVSRLLGGLGTALSRCQAGDLDVYAAVLKVACPTAPAAEEAREAFVFDNLAQLAIPVATYVWSLQNGGRMPRPAAAGEAGAEPDSGESAGNGEPAPAESR